MSDLERLGGARAFVATLLQLSWLAPEPYRGKLRAIARDAIDVRPRREIPTNEELLRLLRETAA